MVSDWLTILLIYEKSCSFSTAIGNPSPKKTIVLPQMIKISADKYNLITFSCCCALIVRNVTDPLILDASIEEFKSTLYAVMFNTGICVFSASSADLFLPVKAPVITW